MISVFCQADLYGSILALVARERAHVTGDWRIFESGAAAAACLVVVQRWLAAGDTVARLASLTRLLPLHPLVLATNKDADNARSFRSLAVAEVVWLHELDHTLWPAVHQASTRGCRHALAARIEAAPRIAPPLREALTIALTAERPFHTLDALATAIGRCRGTIWYHWHHATLEAPDAPRPEDFLDWVLLLHAVTRKTPARSWSDVACELGVHEHTLARLARRLLGATTRTLSQASGAGLVECFTRDVLEKLGVGADVRATAATRSPAPRPPSA